MKKRLGVFLGACVMLSVVTLPVSAQNSENFVERAGANCELNAKETVKEEIDPLQSGETLTIYNFEELKALVAEAENYGTATTVFYNGLELIIEEDLTIPSSNLNMVMTNVRVPSGVTLTISDDCAIDEVDVEGTLVLNNTLSIDDCLNITGEVMDNAMIMLMGPVNTTGLDKITYSTAGRLLWYYQLRKDDVEVWKDAMAAANVETDSHVSYQMELWGDLTIDESMKIPDRVIILASSSEVTIAEGCTVELYGRFLGNMNVLGNLNNSGSITLYSNNKVTFVDSSSYIGNGWINVYNVERAKLSSIVPGLDLKQFVVTKNDLGSSFVWELHLGNWYNRFVDIESGAYYEKPVLWAVGNKITNGYGSETTFCPEINCTRGQVVTFLWRAEGSPEPTSLENPFTDVAEDAYYYKAVLWAVEQGITNGYGSETTFCPDMECTRGQVATFMWRAMGEPVVSNVQNTFGDVKSGEYYYDAVLWAVENGVTNGYGSADTFCPDVICNRGQIVTFLYRGLN